MSVVLPPGKLWATPADWERHRELITDLYAVKKTTLSEVMTTMQDEHSFFATKKMYKSRFDKWGLQKNFRAKQVSELLRQKRQRDAVGKVSEMRIGNVTVDPERLESYLMRVSEGSKRCIDAAVADQTPLPDDGEHSAFRMVVVCRTPSPTQSAGWPTRLGIPQGRRLSGVVRAEGDDQGRHACLVPSPSATHLIAPDVLLRAEVFISGAKNLVSWKISVGQWGYAWDADARDAQSENDEWLNRLVNGIELLGNGRTRRAFKLFGSCFSQLTSLIQCNAIQFIPDLHFNIIRIQNSHPDLAIALKRHAYKLAITRFGLWHPLSIFLRELLAMDYSESRLNWRSVIEYYWDTLEASPAGETDWLLQINENRHYSYYCMGFLGVLDWGTVESFFLSGIAPRDALRPQAQCLKLDTSLAFVYRFQGNVNRSRLVLIELLQKHEDEPWFSASDWPVRISDLMMRFAIILGELEDAKEHGEKALALATERWGLADIKTMDILEVPERIYHKLGDTEAVNKTSLAVDKSLNDLSKRFEETTLSGCQGIQEQLESHSDDGIRPEEVT